MKKFFILLITNFILASSIHGQLPPLSPSKPNISPLKSTPSQPKPTQSLKENEEGIVFFTPPNGWMLADQASLPGRVKTMVIGKGPSSFPPSLNLSSEPYKGTLKQYLKIVKNMNTAQGYEWKDLGSIQTQAGLGSLSQVDTKSQWGTIRLMHVIVVKNGNVYILTASAMKDEFSIFYNDFFKAMRSLKIVNDLYELVNDTQQRNQLKTDVSKLQMQWQSLVTQKQTENPQISLLEAQESVFNSADFQKTIWTPFKEMIKQKYSQLGSEWQTLFLQKTEDQLFNLKS